MSYLVLARKWRPQSFGEVIGQSHVTRTLQNALGSNKVAHALLFSGPRGVGKTSVARILAKSLNCESGPAKDPCNRCTICEQITTGSCVDVNEIDGASNRGIDEIRQLREEIRFQPVQCRFRIYIIDEVHMLTNEAFNALLKTLEEPPPHAYFIFATTEPRKIPETIHSRCQHYEFRRLSETDLAAHLDRIVAKEGLGLPREATQLLARQAQGSVRDSLSLLDQVAAFGAESYEDVCQALGVAGLATIEELAAAILASDVSKALSILNRVYEMGIDLQHLARDLLGFLRDLAVIKKVGVKNAAALTSFSRERLEELGKGLAKVPFNTLLQAMDVLSSGMDELYRSLTPKTCLEILVMKICSLQEFVHIDKVLEGLERLLLLYEEADAKEAVTKEAIAQDATLKEPLNTEARPDGPSETPKSCAIKQQDDPDSYPEAETDPAKMWPEFIKFVQKQSPSLGSVLDACLEVKSTGNDQLEVICTADVRGEMLLGRERTSQINSLASRFFKRPVNISFRLKREEAAPLENGAGNGNSAKRPNPRDELIQNPLVQETINIFQARISNVTLFGRYKKNKRQRS